MAIVAPLFAPILGWFKGLFAGVLGFFGLELTKKVAILIAGLAFISSITLGLWAAFNGIVSTLAVVMPSEIVTASTWLVPDNLDEGFAAIVSIRVARFIYDYKVQATKLRIMGT
jgi:predicted benzoate:H+ symporter BenE